MAENSMETRRFFSVLAVSVRAACLSARAWGNEPIARSMSLTTDQWNEALAAFAAADRTQAPPAGGGLCVGSSSIRLWDGLESQFADSPVVLKRGFGGS